MKKLKLTIDLLPKGAWGNNFSRTLPKKDWDVLREACYKRAGYKCVICGDKNGGLEAHEIWDFNIVGAATGRPQPTQTLVDIQALCTACHGVKHFRNSERMGYGWNAKNHFLKINKCSEMDFAAHAMQAEMMFDERNEILRWHVNADLDKFGGAGIEYSQREIPYIVSPYDGVDWDNCTYEKEKLYSNELLKGELGGECFAVIAISENNKKTVICYSTKSTCAIPAPKINAINVDNYQGEIKINTQDCSKIECIADGQIIEKKYNVSGQFIVKFKVENFAAERIRFQFYGKGGKTATQNFRLTKI